MEEAFSNNLMAYYYLSTVVTLITAICEILLFKEGTMNKLLNQVNKLLTAAQLRLIRRCAKQLVQSDRFDEVFFDAVVKESGLAPSTNVVDLGADFALVRKTVVSKTRVASVSEVK